MRRVKRIRTSASEDRSRPPRRDAERNLAGLKGDLAAIHTALRISERRGKLFGLDQTRLDFMNDDEPFEFTINIGPPLRPLSAQRP